MLSGAGVQHTQILKGGKRGFNVNKFGGCGGFQFSSKKIIRGEIQICPRIIFTKKIGN